MVFRFRHYFLAPLHSLEFLLFPLVLLVQEASRQSSADLNKIKLYDFTVMESEENREWQRRDGDERTWEGGRWGAVEEA